MSSPFNPTAANIISSLGIKGATVNEKLPGFVPVLDENGQLSVDFIPASAAQLTIPPPSDVVFVDPNTNVPEYAPDGRRVRTGSVTAPFKSMTEAAKYFEPADGASPGGDLAMVLCPGEYEDYALFQKYHPSRLFIIGLGQATLSASGCSISGLSSIDGPPKVFLQNVYTVGALAIDSSAYVTVLGRSYIGSLHAQSGSALYLSSESVVDSVDGGFGSIQYLSEAQRIKNTSSVAGATARDALDRLGGRKVRIAKTAGSGSGFDAESSFVDISADSAGGFDVFDLRDRDMQFVSAIKDLYSRLRNIVCDTVHANSVVADVVSTKELRMDSIVMGGYRLAIDSYGYLVVMDGSATPPRPPDSVTLLRDSVTGAIYMLGVADGRMYVKLADQESAEVHDVLTIYDPDSGSNYSVSIANGRLEIDRQQSRRAVQAVQAVQAAPEDDGERKASKRKRGRK